jgi:formimidoylglutamate deiminase
LPGPVLPGLVNAHSHAFQRAMAGLTERRSAGAHASDDFWSWRDRMYSAANRITPEQLEAIATQLYAELLAGGYTQVCDFHYLHNDSQRRGLCRPGRDVAGPGARRAAHRHRPHAAAHALHALGLQGRGPA